MYYKTEHEIMEKWQGNKSKPLVSVCTITYNHEKYIREAIDSFLMQETNFPFEIVVGEDCSLDNTKKILDAYVKRYPNIIKLVSSEKNVGANKNSQRTMSACLGEYMAACEGDDYWTDKYKLQIQIDEMKKHPEVNISFHPVYELKDARKGKVLAKHSNKNKIFSTSEVILGEGGFMPTNSLVVKKEVINNLPEWFHEEAPVGDYFIQIFGARNAGALYINKVMGIYRTNHTESWSHSLYDDKKIITYVEKMRKVMKFLDNDLEKKYSKEINKCINLYYWSVIKYKGIKNDDKILFYEKNLDKFSRQQIFLWHMIFSKPRIDKVLRYLYEKIK